uniref:Very-long-chain enoyl-CoA reductase-like n=1 Tax=Rhizophora mucronata TaxID=61149 RepID=A0A2P2N005_RHIMU
MYKLLLLITYLLLSLFLNIEIFNHTCTCKTLAISLLSVVSLFHIKFDHIISAESLVSPPFLRDNNHIILCSYHLENRWNESLDIFRKILKLGNVPASCGTAPAHQIESCSKSKGGGVHCLRNEGNPPEAYNLEQIVGAHHQVKQCSPRHLVLSIIFASHPGEEVMEVEVTTNPHQK